MFKKVFQSIRRTFTRGEEARPGNRGNTRRQSSDKPHALLERISAPSPAPAARSSAPASTSSAPASRPRAGRPRSPEELCGISPKMSKDEIKARLAFLYRRYNRATSSLDENLRAEAEIMLDAIVAVRERTFGPI